MTVLMAFKVRESLAALPESAKYCHVAVKHAACQRVSDKLLAWLFSVAPFVFSVAPFVFSFAPFELAVAPFVVQGIVNAIEVSLYCRLSPSTRDTSVPTPLRSAVNGLLLPGADGPLKNCCNASRSLSLSVCTSTIKL